MAVFSHKSPVKVLSKGIPLVVGVLCVTVKALKNAFSTRFLPPPPQYHRFWHRIFT